jgi:hypothetical protein
MKRDDFVQPMKDMADFFQEFIEPPLSQDTVIDLLCAVSNPVP